MRDLDVRLAVRSRLQREHEGDHDTRIVEEMGIWHGSVRIDVAVINGEIAGYELKSARDTLERLPAQASLYSEVFNRVFLVAAEKHLDHAIELLPEWWGVLVATASGEGVQLQELRPSHRNPGVSPLQVARLLWRSEGLGILEKHGLERGFKNASREKISQQLADTLAPTHLEDEVRRCLKDRETWLRQPVGN